MNARQIFALVLTVAGGIACLGAPSLHMNYYLIPGGAAVLIGSGIVVWDYFSGKARAKR